MRLNVKGWPVFRKKIGVRKKINMLNRFDSEIFISIL